ncbi:MAG: hypothetical protein JJT77_13530 [Crocinitomicaceae bacterium]|nr:hypothetical protein [Crocinitomicaceae bacterium]
MNYINYTFSIVNLCLFSMVSWSQSSFHSFNDNPKESNVKREERRSIANGTHIISFLAANNQYPLIIKDPSLLMDGEITRGIPLRKPFFNIVDGLYINYQFSLPKNIFLEAGFKYLKYWTYFETNEWVLNYYDHLSGFSTLSFSFGGGYRLIGKNNLRFFDLHSGFSLGITDNQKGSGQSLSNYVNYIDNNGNLEELSYSWQYQITSRYSLGFYLGASKDIRVTKNLYTTVRYHYQFGKSSELTDHVINYNISSLNLSNTVRASNTAKGQMVAIGLRWLFDK